ncbi:MAG: hypothetical protein AAGG01_12670, partial [Planctomycetota bacterium]
RLVVAHLRHDLPGVTVKETDVVPLRRVGLVGQQDELSRVGGLLHDDGIGMEEAADAAELVLLTDETDATQWNNVGLFHRDAGQVVAQMRDYEPKMTAKEHYERSWEAYSKALAMQRTSYHLNDAAVLLHYYLERDYDTAIAMYDEAEAMATERLEKGGLSAEEKPLVEIALRDAKNNRALLKKKIEDAQKKDAQKKDAEKKGDEGTSGDEAGGGSGGGANG